MSVYLVCRQSRQCQYKMLLVHLVPLVCRQSRYSYFKILIEVDVDINRFSSLTLLLEQMSSCIKHKCVQLVCFLCGQSRLCQRVNLTHRRRGQIRSFQYLLSMVALTHRVTRVQPLLLINAVCPGSWGQELLGQTLRYIVCLHASFGTAVDNVSMAVS